MTREEALEKLSNIERVEGNWVIGYYLVPTEELIDQIYNDHEAQLKLASDVYSTDKMHMYQELKAKDEEIERLKAKHEIQLNHRKAQSARLRRYNPSRSIVAMLFWEWKKSQRWAGKNHFASKGNEDAFKKAYKILKEQQ